MLFLNFIGIFASMQGMVFARVSILTGHCKNAVVRASSHQVVPCMFCGLDYLQLFFILILFVAQLREIKTVVYDMHFLLYRLTF